MIVFVKTYGAFPDYMLIFAKDVCNSAFFSFSPICLVAVNCIFGCVVIIA